MFENEPETDELRTTLSVDEAEERLRALLPGARLKSHPMMRMFDVSDGDRAVAVVTVFKDQPTLVEARYLAGLSDPRCASLRANLRALFADTSAEVSTPPAPTTFRERLLAKLLDKRESGVRVRRLHFGPPASDALIARIERDHLGFPMPEAMRAFFAAHDGFSLFFHRVDDPAAEIFDHSVPLHVESDAPIPWNEACWDGGPLWSEIEAADYSASGGFFYVGLICVPPLSVMFDTDWGSIMGWPAGMVLFDAFHPFYGSALVVDRAAGEVFIQPTADAGADRDADRVSLSDYLETLIDTAGSDRKVNGRYQAVRASG